MKMYFHIFSALSTDTAHVMATLVKDGDMSVLHGQYHGYWWLGNTRSRGTRSHDVALFIPEYSSLNTSGPFY